MNDQKPPPNRAQKSYRTLGFYINYNQLVGQNANEYGPFSGISYLLLVSKHPRIRTNNKFRKITSMIWNGITEERLNSFLNPERDPVITLSE